jgi:DNA-binding response OmpR family regulator
VRVLLADDERLLADTVADGLRKFAMAVDVCYDGEAAIERLGVNHYDVAVLDRDMPKATGDEVCRWLIDASIGTRMVLDIPRHRAFRDGRLLDLTPKEFAVLSVLMHAAGNVVSAEELLEKAWDEHADPFTNAVRVAVMTLRRKLGDPPIVHTVPRVGYRFGE